MRFSFKKTLASILSAVLMLTTVLGALTTSADVTYAGTLTLEDAQVTSSTEEFDVEAVLSLNQATTFLALLFQLDDLPEGVTLSSASIGSLGEATVNSDKRLVLFDIGDISVSLVPITLTFTASGIAESFTISVVSYECADVSEEFLAIDITDTAEVQLEASHGADTNVWLYDENVHYNPCLVEDCDERFNEAPHAPAQAVVENEIPATHTVAGSYDSVVYCSVCGYEISRTNVEVPAGGHEYVYTDNGDGTHTVTCTGCDYNAVEDHNFVDGVCVCGAEEPSVGPIVDDTLTFVSAFVGFGTSSLQLAFRINNSVLDKYPDMDVVIIPQKYDTTTLNLIENPPEIVVNKADLEPAGTTRKQYFYRDIQLYELGLDINYMLRAYDAQGNLVAVSEVFTTSAAAYLKSSIQSVSDPKFKTVATDTLIVCDEVMKNVAATYPNSDLANATSVIAGFDISYATQEVGPYNTINEFHSYAAGYGTESTDVHQVRTSVQIGKVPFINFRIADQNKVLDLNKLVVTVSYISKDSAGEHPYNRSFTGSDFTYAGKYINCTFDEVGLHDSDKDILFEVTYDGVKVCDLTYSIETYTGANQSTAGIGPCVVALLKLGQSFRAYQGL